MDIFEAKRMLRRPLFDVLHEFQKENNIKNSEFAYILADAISFWTYQTAKVVEAYEDDRNDSV
jgi:hypothetical protein